ncbi:MAG: amidohydrolase [Bacteroidetes bacterium MedPE-SWsnd-G2]|nr:MAG: amidohydrolase [Bacteroidetes bacterium MedPE-SWsnd-G2]
MNKAFAMLFMFLISSMSICGQDYFPKNDGVMNSNHHFIAITNAKIHLSPEKVIENGTLLIKDGKVMDSGENLKLPDNTVVYDIKGNSVYPSFIDIYSNFGVAKAKRATGQNPQYDASRTGYYWNDHIKPEQNAIDKFNYDKKAATELLKNGFGVVNTHNQDGIVRGTGLLVALNNSGSNANRIIADKSAQYLAFSKSVTSRQSYPTSLMGSMALLRQMYLDAEWYANGHSLTKDRSLEALNNNKSLTQIFTAGSKTNALRADKVGDEFNIQYVILGGGNEYERISEIKATNAKMIIPINFKKPYNVEDTELSKSISLGDLKAWNQQGSNLTALESNGVTFALTSHSLKSIKDFKQNLLTAISYGFSKEMALKSLTTIPASILNQESNIGTLENGKYANFFITSGDVFEKSTKTFEHWVQGQQNIFDDINSKDLTGTYKFNLNGDAYTLKVSGPSKKLKTEVTANNLKLGSSAKYKGDWLNLSITTPDTVSKKFIRISANTLKNNKLVGTAILPNGNKQSFNAVLNTSEDSKKELKPKEAEKMKSVMPISFPNVAYGFNEKPKSQTLLFKNATVWTNESEGVLKQTDVLVKDGKIAKIGRDLSSKNAIVIDATNKHLTAGIIDEHSHIAADAINEAGQNSSAEVSIEDVINDEDISIYQNLAGGVTSIQILHGSANPIGGRSAIIKLKWGESAEDLIFPDTPKFIKFALGENVKQSNWGDRQTVRFPQTRMGTEQVYVDYFSRAKAYQELKASGKPYRKDIELETLLEILNKERFISCHSYVQSEINMLMKVAESFNFNINTFTHILEGYKVADKMKAHGVGGSTFSDWWAYKYEVNDAIPYNAAIMHNQGVVTAINSDDAEMSRRLNQEAAKSIKYGGVSEEDAWKFVTLNPAKLLHIDHKVGSIKVGKDADLVLWSDHPMSIYAKAEKTIIEGVTYFDIERDKQLRAQIKKDKSALINEMMEAKNSGMSTQPIKKKEKEHMHCDTGSDVHFIEK